MKKISLSLLFILSFGLNIESQSLSHPIIYATPDDRPRILDLIDKQVWAKSIVTQLRTNVDAKLATHQTNPGAITTGLPAFPATDNNSESSANPIATAHNRVLTTASYSAMLYYITQEEKYAQFSGDILNYYFNLLESKTPANATICGNFFYDPRTVTTHLAITYDFIFNFLKLPNTSVYNTVTKMREPVNHAKAQKALLNVIGNGLSESGGKDTYGRFISNHHILTGPGVLFPILCVDDDKERERLFNVFWETGTRRQASFKNTVLAMFGAQGIWPESTSYGFMPNISMLLNVIDRVKPELNVYKQTKGIFDGMFLFENLRHPDRRFVRYGDSRRSIDASDEGYRFALNFAKREKDTALQNKAEVALRQYYDASGGYKPTLPSSIFDNFGPLELFWGEVLPTGTVPKFDFKPTIIIEHAGVALQRNHVENQNNIYGMCGIIGGAHYVHSHCTGIAMEIYGAGYIMGPNGGLPRTLAERSLPEHKNYFMRHGGNNTIIVNGSSRGRQQGSWSSSSYLWQNTTVNVGAEPKHLEDPISKNFSFSTQFLKDEINNCDQQRTLGIIRTSETSAYYFDMFRSKSLGTNNFHDYLYHNLGDETIISTEKNEVLPLEPTTRYTTDVGDPVKSPGWSLLESTVVTKPTDEAMKVRFRMAFDNKFMHLFVPGGVGREYTRALGPATREAINGYISKKTQVIGIRQQGEAWARPFIGVFEPTITAQPSVQSVEQLRFNNITVGAIVRSKVAGRDITDYVLNNENADSELDLPILKLKFKGRYAVVRTEQVNNKPILTMYIGEGSLLTFESYSLIGDVDNKGIMVFENVVLNSHDLVPAQLEVYPNPSNGEFTIVPNASNWKSLSLYNLLGQKLYTNTSGDNKVVVSSTDYGHKAGVYIIELINEQSKKITHKVIVK